ncbi:cysteine synthase A [Kordiimonas aquimaris]|uniref:cysteine synthase A n=1 Tax=Kordiimonas aquimaris TaxID=707591 RepID=UPI0021D3C9B3|nr:cysteine synthase A [Kordiimonas aquimaris]
MAGPTGAIAAIGNTPLIKLKYASELTGCTILGKAEYANPGGSLKDRPALNIIEDAEKKGLLEPGGLIVEGTAGNTGIGLTVVANAKGYRTLIVMPETQAKEKIDTLRVMGAGLKLVPAAPYSNPNNFQHVARRLSEELASSEQHGVIWANQFDNVANREAHVKTTAQEIWQQTEGKVDAFITAVGSGGSLAGTAIGLKEHNKDIVIGLADPMGAAMYSYFKTGELKSEGGSISEGIGQSRITANIDGAPIDEAFQISDQEGVPLAFDLLAKEGLCVGSSSGINLAGAIRLAKQMGPGHTIVTLLCDSGLRYQSKLFNPEFLRSKDLPVPAWLS